MSDLWTDAALDYSDDDAQHLARLTACRAETVHLWPFLAAAKDGREYIHRKGLVTDTLDAVVAKVLPNDPVGFSNLRAALEAEFDADFDVISQERAKEAEVRARVAAKTGERKKVMVTDKSHPDYGRVRTVEVEKPDEDEVWVGRPGNVNEKLRRDQVREYPEPRPKTGTSDKVPAKTADRPSEYAELGKLFKDQEKAHKEKGVSGKNQPDKLPCSHCGAEAEFDKIYFSFPSSYANYRCSECGKETHYKPVAKESSKTAAGNFEHGTCTICGHAQDIHEADGCHFREVDDGERCKCRVPKTASKVAYEGPETENLGDRCPSCRSTDKRRRLTKDDGSRCDDPWHQTTSKQATGSQKVEVWLADWERMRARGDDRKMLFENMNDGYKPGHPVRLAIAYDAPGEASPYAVCEHAFHTFNVGEDELAQRYRAGRNRSLSVGDVVVVAGKAYACKSVGFEPVADFNPKQGKLAWTPDASDVTPVARELMELTDSITTFQHRGDPQYDKDLKALTAAIRDKGLHERVSEQDMLVLEDYNYHITNLALHEFGLKWASRERRTYSAGKHYVVVSTRDATKEQIEDYTYGSPVIEWKQGKRGNVGIIEAPSSGGFSADQIALRLSTGLYGATAYSSYETAKEKFDEMWGFYSQASLGGMRFDNDRGVDLEVRDYVNPDLQALAGPRSEPAAKGQCSYCRKNLQGRTICPHCGFNTETWTHEPATPYTQQQRKSLSALEDLQANPTENPAEGGNDSPPFNQANLEARGQGTQRNPYIPEPTSNPYIPDVPVTPGTPDDMLDGPPDTNPLADISPARTTKPRQLPNSGTPAVTAPPVPQTAQVPQQPQPRVRQGFSSAGDDRGRFVRVGEMYFKEAAAPFTNKCPLCDSDNISPYKDSIGQPGGGYQGYSACMNCGFTQTHDTAEHDVVMGQIDNYSLEKFWHKPQSLSGGVEVHRKDEGFMYPDRLEGYGGTIVYICEKCGESRATFSMGASLQSEAVGNIWCAKQSKWISAADHVEHVKNCEGPHHVSKIVSSRTGAGWVAQCRDCYQYFSRVDEAEDHSRQTSHRVQFNLTHIVSQRGVRCTSCGSTDTERNPNGEGFVCNNCGAKLKRTAASLPPGPEWTTYTGPRGWREYGPFHSRDEAVAAAEQHGEGRGPLKVVHITNPQWVQKVFGTDKEIFFVVTDVTEYTRTPPGEDAIDYPQGRVVWERTGAKTSGRFTIHHSPDPPALWVVYEADKRVAQFEIKEDAQRYVQQHEGGAKTGAALTHQSVKDWLLDYAWLGSPDEQRREVECIMAQFKNQGGLRGLEAQMEHYRGMASGEEQDLESDVMSFILSALYETHEGPHIPSCPHNKEASLQTEATPVTLEQQSEFQGLWDRAHDAGRRAAQEAEEKASRYVFEQHENPLDDTSPVTEQWTNRGRGYMLQGYAWVNLKPATTPFGRWLKDRGLATRDSYEGGLHIYIPGQNYEPRAAYADTLAKVLRDAGYRAYAGSRLD